MEDVLESAPDKSLLIVDDEVPFATRLGRAMEARGFDVRTANSRKDGISEVQSAAPAYAVIDVRLGDGTGFDVLNELKKTRSDAKAILLTGYGNLAQAVSSVKLGAADYLAKPANTDDIFEALVSDTATKAELPENPISADRIKWEHIQRVYELSNRNVSETARRLKMHRRTLQRILAKRAPL